MLLCILGLFLNKIIGNSIVTIQGIQPTTCTGACLIGSNCTQQTEDFCILSDGTFDGFFTTTCNSTVTCPDHHSYTNNTCVSNCNVCFTNQTCINNTCVSICPVCTNQQVCINGSCVSNTAPFLVGVLFVVPVLSSIFILLFRFFRSESEQLVYNNLIDIDDLGDLEDGFDEEPIIENSEFISIGAHLTKHIQPTIIGYRGLYNK
jgi:hypothetical protein